MAKREPRMVSLGYGKFARADRIYALVPLDPKDRGEGRRTYVHVDDMAEPIVASRSERAILRDIEAALPEAAGKARRLSACGQPAPATRRISPFAICPSVSTTNSFSRARTRAFRSATESPRNTGTLH